MKVKLKQDDRFFSFASPLGADKLLVKKFEGTESISQLFEFQLELVSEDYSIEYDDIIGRNVTVGLRLGDERTFRYWNGYVTDFWQLPNTRLANYGATIRPWLWFLTQAKDNFVHQKKSIPEVLETVFSRYNFSSDYELQIKKPGDLPKWDYCVQYQETTFDFVARIMAMQGLYYWFKHSNGSHKMIITDHQSAHQPAEHQSQVKFRMTQGKGVFSEDQIESWSSRRVFKPGKYTHKDYNYLKPREPLKAEVPTALNSKAPVSYEIYEYPGDHEEPQEADVWARWKAEKTEMGHDVAKGTGGVRAMSPGFKITTQELERGSHNKEYLITSVTHSGSEGTFIAGSDAQEAEYSNSFEAMPSNIQYRPSPPPSPAPKIAGVVPAVVVGLSGEEIYNDDPSGLGRVKVQFPWDREGGFNEGSSCWVRVMQTTASNGYGHIWTPRIGDEVVIAFQHGDPDYPVCLGCVYNAVNMPPWPLPAAKNISGVRTNSTKGGGGYHELIFDDSQGEERIYQHSEWDTQIETENDYDLIVDNDRYETVVNNQYQEVGAELHQTVGGNALMKFGGDVGIKISGDFEISAGGKVLISASEIHLKANKICIEGQMGVDLKGGSGNVALSMGGVDINGTMVKLNCGGSASSATQASPGDATKPRSPKAPPY